MESVLHLRTQFFIFLVIGCTAKRVQLSNNGTISGTSVKTVQLSNNGTILDTSVKTVQLSNNGTVSDTSVTIASTVAPNTTLSVPISAQNSTPAITNAPPNGSDNTVPVPYPPGACGQTSIDPMASNHNRGRIVGGHEAKPYSIPWIVRLERGVGQDKSHFCGATLIRVNKNVEESDIIITAAHCNELGWQPSMIKAIAGDHNIYDRDLAQQLAIASQFITHEQFNDETMENDIAVIKLKTPIKFTRTAYPVCLPEPGDHLSAGIEGVVAGWGYMKEGSHLATNLQQLIVPILNNSRCNQFYSKANPPAVVYDESMFCAGYASGGHDSCQGDSGGPLSFKGHNGYVLQGVVSFGEGCARSTFPGIYTRVSNYIDWINRKVAQLSETAKRTS